MLVLKKVKPLSDGVITTGDKYDAVYTEGGLIDPSKSGQFKEHQVVLFASDASISRGINVGDIVLVNFYNYARPVQKKGLSDTMDENYHAAMAFHIPTIEINKQECLNLKYGDILFIIEEMEEVLENPNGTFQKRQIGLKPLI